ncbi:MAG: selenium metabolism-associated LysR family transcriptional regulator [Parvibaculum sp.]|uniref:selenium metabolism-associated LysR family transcriptional regulator n=1 Tax=Parvibaculum sp. TaxID=2024848 RepID=UPI002731E70E|nr:selenium metabolism-associated LysR family transcriptional regulator [Parvibaculum sp.]MDP2151605.1 selenium metabolism-associated LysR family transcriptional regulator [Parvibaculum sp.]
MDIHHLKVFLAVFKNRSFSKASGELHLTQPTVSSHIKAMEDELGCRLFDRAGRTIIPTKEAELLHTHASGITEGLDAIKTALGLIKEKMEGELVIGASTIPGTYIIPSAVAQFRSSHPDISLQVVIGDSKKITDMVASNELLAGVVGAKMGRGKIEYTPFIEDKLLLVCSPELSDKRVISKKGLAALPFIIREEGSGTRKMMESHLSEMDIGIKDMNITGVLGSTESVKEAVKAGLGASILSMLAVRDELGTGRLAEIKIKGIGDMKRNFYVITNKKRTLPAHYRGFLNHLLKAEAF